MELGITQILKNLYSFEIDFILKEINNSIYVTDYGFDKDECFLIHTGFTFKMQNGKEIELYYDFINKVLIRQLKISENPAILGLIYSFWNSYITIWEEVRILTFYEQTEEFDTTEFDQENFKKESLTFFEIKKTLREDAIFTLDTLFMEWSERLYFNGSTFHEIEDDENDEDDDNSYNYNNSFNDDEENGYWSCDACGGSNNTGCLSSTGDCYM